MQNHRLIGFGIACVFLLSSISCSNDDSSNVPLLDDVIIGDNDSIPDPVDIPAKLGDVEFLNPGLVSNDLILVNDASANRAFIMDKQAMLWYEWELSNNIGNDVFLLPDARLLASLESDNPIVPFGGKGGRLQFVDKDGNIEWDYIYSTPDAETHHDAELLPNGNVIAMVWAKRTADEVVAAGSKYDTIIYTEAIIEIDPSTDEIVWEWHDWDHMVQDFDDSKDNFGVIADNPQLIDLNYIPDNGGWPQATGDLTHANAIAYDEVNDVIFLSVNFYSEVWVIDHSTTTEQAAGHTGGNYGKGGDLIYRFGNPETYDNLQGTRLFYSQHFPNPLKGDDQGKMLIFSNGNNRGQSAVYEFQLPENYALLPNTDNEPEILWEFTDPDLFAARVSGAVPLSNGNILITEGDYGFWEVTRDKEVVWKFEGDGFYWRGYSYNRGAPEIGALGLTF
ncbi:MAG: aryl-sulfate sulfotransferase [Bacteroidia bacterium]|nr:aryl-sulfate sulfotransferase [Bacteroidia bacterium]